MQEVASLGELADATRSLGDTGVTKFASRCRHSWGGGGAGQKFGLAGYRI